MIHRLFGQVAFSELLVRIDDDWAEQVRQGGCACGGCLHRADYPRAPRGGPPGLPEAYGKRRSFCCAVAGCRKRVTPWSVRFLGRRWYLAPVVILVTALQHGFTAPRLRGIQGWCGDMVPRRTLGRWRRWWRETFVTTPFWRGLRGRFARPVAEEGLPGSLLEAFTGDGPTKLVATLELLGPLTTGSCAHFTRGPWRR